MAYQLRYATKTYRPGNDVIPDNEASSTPVEFDLAPAEGTDLARLKSIIVGMGGLVADMPWTADAQHVVTSSIQNGASAFTNTVRAVRNLTVPAGMALRAAIVAQKDIPKRVLVPGQPPAPDLEAQIPVRTGFEFARVCGFVPVLSMHLGKEILELTNESGIDPRFFVPPSGSGGQETPATPDGSATAVQQPPDANATADVPTSAGN